MEQGTGEQGAVNGERGTVNGERPPTTGTRRAIIDLEENPRHYLDISAPGENRRVLNVSSLAPRPRLEGDSPLPIL